MPGYPRVDEASNRCEQASQHQQNDSWVNELKHGFAAGSRYAGNPLLASTCLNLRTLVVVARQRLINLVCPSNDATSASSHSWERGGGISGVTEGVVVAVVGVAEAASVVEVVGGSKVGAGGTTISLVEVRGVVG